MIHVEGNAISAKRPIRASVLTVLPTFTMTSTLQEIASVSLATFMPIIHVNSVLLVVKVATTVPMMMELEELWLTTLHSLLALNATLLPTIF